MEVGLRWIWHGLLLVLCVIGCVVVAMTLWSVAAQPSVTAAISPPDSQPVAFPFQIRGTSLTVKAVTAYSGAFYEDGTGRQVTDAAALVVENTGRQDIQWGQVTAEWEGERMTFSFSYLPAGGVLLVPEQTGKKYRADAPLTCEAQVEGALIGWHIGCVYVDEGQEQLQLTNGTAEPLEGATVYYKHRDPDTGMLIGGYTFSFQLECLNPGEKCLLNPRYYTPGTARVVAVIPQ